MAEAAPPHSSPAFLNKTPALLALEDGRVFHGSGFGAVPLTASGEVCFNTSMSGYQEVLTDPSYFGQIVTMTYPLIGNYGINELDAESRQPFVRGFVVEELSPAPSSWRSEKTLSEYLREHGIPAIEGIDTRALTMHLRTRGAMKGCLTTDPAVSVETAIETAKASPGVIAQNFMAEVTTPESFRWEDHPLGTRSGAWTILNSIRPNAGPGDDPRLLFEELPPLRHTLVAFDLGMKYNILRRLRQYGFDTTVVPAQTSAEEILRLNPDAIFLSNGPGDPDALDGIVREVGHLIGKKPIFGICLGHQVLGRALGAETFKLKFGHRGGNQPVKDLQTGLVSITSQNHGFAVDADKLPSNVEVTHINLNDETVEGLRHRDEPVFSVQYHPEAAPGPHDARYFFGEFAKLIDAVKARA